MLHPTVCVVFGFDVRVDLTRFAFPSPDPARPDENTALGLRGKRQFFFFSFTAPLTLGHTSLSPPPPAGTGFPIVFDGPSARFSPPLGCAGTVPRARRPRRRHGEIYTTDVRHKSPTVHRVCGHLLLRQRRRPIVTRVHRGYRVRRANSTRRRATDRRAETRPSRSSGVDVYVRVFV